MKYITHHRFHGLALCGKRVNLPYGMVLTAAGGCLFTQDGRAICYPTSENAKRHFAPNDDGRGLERGRLTYAIAYSARNAGKGFRFSEEERRLLERDWGHFLRRDVDVLLFNEDFFAARPEQLQRLADALHIKVRR